MKLKQVWAEPDRSIRAHDSNRDEFVVANVGGSFEHSAEEYLRDIVTAVNCHEPAMVALQSAQVAIKGIVDAGHAGDRDALCRAIATAEEISLPQIKAALAKASGEGEG